MFRRRILCALSLFGLASCLNAPAGPVLAQVTTADAGSATTVSKSANISTEDRNRLYEEVARDVEAFERQGRALKKLITLVKPTVVHIEAEHHPADAGRGRRSTEETGSGVVIDLNGKNYVLTNRHVIKDAPIDRIKIKLADGRWLKPTKVWMDSGSDVAVVAITAKNITTARLAERAATDVGDFVLAVGSPFGLSHSVTFGIISAKGRRELQLGAEGVQLQDFLQTDAAINPGNSGGPLLNLRGEVIGINTAIASMSGSNDGVGFSIPIAMAMHVARQLIDHGSLVQAYLGVHLDNDFTEERANRLGLSRPEGARVTFVVANSPASEAKLQVDDVVTEFNGIHVEDDDHLVNLVRLTVVGKEVPVVVVRKGMNTTLKVVVADRVDFASEK